MKEEEGADHIHQDHSVRQEDAEEPMPADPSHSNLKKGSFDQEWPSRVPSDMHFGFK
jgi:hypothetical protein